MTEKLSHIVWRRLNAEHDPFWGPGLEEKIIKDSTETVKIWIQTVDDIIVL